MKLVRKAAMAAGASLALIATAAQAQQAAQRVCVPPREAEALLLVLAPEMLRQVGTRCAPTLPAGALLKRSDGRLVAKYQAEVAAAMPLARQALKKITGPDAAGLMDSDLGPAMVVATMAPMLAAEIKPADCPAIDKVLGYIEPLPAKNTAGLLATILQLASDKDKKSKLPICPFVTK